MIVISSLRPPHQEVQLRSELLARIVFLESDAHAAM
jgi:hypothetical protein